MSHAKVRSALATAFIGGTFFDADKISWPNILFTPPAAAAWAIVTFLPAQAEVATLGDAGQDELNGLLQVDLNYPMGSGEKDASDKFEAIRALFKPGASFTYSGQVVRIRSCGRTHGRVVNNFFRITASIFFYAYINR